MELSIVIVNWNTRRLLRACLQSLQVGFDRNAGAWEVIVVDNDSSDGSREMLTAEFPWVLRIDNPSNTGFAAANNQALQMAGGKFFLLLNADTVVPPEGLSRLLQFMRENPYVGAAGPRLLNPNGSLQTSCYPEPTLFREFWRVFHLDRFRPVGVYDMRGWDPLTPRTVDNILGACMLLRRETVDQVGPMDEGYFMYSEEIDWCLRIRRAGWQIWWVPQAEIVHLGGQSTRQSRREMFLHLYRGKIRYFRKHHGKFQAGVYKSILAAAALGRLSISWLAYAQQPPTRQENLLLASYYRQLLRLLPGM